MSYKERLDRLCESVDRESVIDSLITKINKHAWVPIKDVEFAKHLMKIRTTDAMLKHDLFNNLSTDKTSTRLFSLQRTDPTIPIVMVNISFLSQKKGNPVSQTGAGGKSVNKLIDLIKQKTKFDSVPGFSLRSNKVEEGNHRVEALKQLGYKSCPVVIWDGWD